ncbi:MAG: acylphosphatase, partial [Methanotrichaceae archaeon]|nr:acylphosphatase [Methanotrichaceae archaeon]
MMQLVAYVSGKVQKVGYRARVVQIANALKIKGMIENLDDGRVKIVAEGEEKALEYFEDAIDIKNTLISVEYIEQKYLQASGNFTSFYKLVEPGEPESRLDEGIDILRDILTSINNINANLSSMNANLGCKMDKMLKQQGEMLKQQ